MGPMRLSSFRGGSGFLEFRATVLRRHPWLEPGILEKTHAFLAKYHIEYDERYVWD